MDIRMKSTLSEINGFQMRCILTMLNKGTDYLYMFLLGCTAIYIFAYQYTNLNLVVSILSDPIH